MVEMYCLFSIVVAVNRNYNLRKRIRYVWPFFRFKRLFVFFIESQLYVYLRVPVYVVQEIYYNWTTGTYTNGTSSGRRRVIGGWARARGRRDSGGKAGTNGNRSRGRSAYGGASWIGGCARARWSWRLPAKHYLCFPCVVGPVGRNARLAALHPISR